LHPCQAGFVALFAGCHPATLAGKTGENLAKLASIFWLRVRNWGKKSTFQVVGTNQPSTKFLSFAQRILDMENG